MNLRFLSPRVPDPTNPLECAQAAAAGKLYDGTTLDGAARLGAAPCDDEFLVFFYPLIYPVEVDGVLTYDAWVHNISSGALFHTGTTKVVAALIESSWESEDPELEKVLPFAWEAFSRAGG